MRVLGENGKTRENRREGGRVLWHFGNTWAECRTWGRRGQGGAGLSPGDSVAACTESVCLEERVRILDKCLGPSWAPWAPSGS